MDAIFLVTHFNETWGNRMAPAGAMFQAATQSMRAVPTTGFPAAIGLLPAAFSTTIGRQVQRPLAIVEVGGMPMGPILLLLVVPVLQTLFAGGEDQAENPAEEEEEETV